MKHHKRLYDLVVEIPQKGKPPEIKRMRYRAIDSIHAALIVQKFFGHGAKVTSAKVVKK